MWSPQESDGHHSNQLRIGSAGGARGAGPQDTDLCSNNVACTFLSLIGDTGVPYAAPIIGVGIERDVILAVPEAFRNADLMPMDVRSYSVEVTLQDALEPG